ncbi:hypothetical protein [Desulforhopalus sp. 52FAK]
MRSNTWVMGCTEAENALVGVSLFQMNDLKLPTIAMITNHLQGGNMTTGKPLLHHIRLLNIMSKASCNFIVFSSMKISIIVSG